MTNILTAAKHMRLDMSLPDTMLIDKLKQMGRAHSGHMSDEVHYEISQGGSVVLDGTTENRRRYTARQFLRTIREESSKTRCTSQG